MPLFQYRAQDNQGRTVEGMVTADTAQAATQDLVQRGFRIFDLAQKGGAVPAPSPARPPTVSQAPVVRPQIPPQPQVQPQPQRQAPVSYHTPQRRVKEEGGPIIQNAPRPAVNPMASGPQRVNMPQSAPVQVVKTPRGSDKANTFIFSQLAGFFRAGINPAEAFTQLGNNQPKAWYQQSLLEAAKATAEGLRFSQVLERYPNLYPPHIPGMIRAGEEGGFLVEATEAVAEQTMTSMKFKVWPTLLFWWFLSNIIFLPAVFILTQSLDRMTVVYFGDHPTGSSNGKAELWTSIVKATIWPVGPLTIVITLVCLGLVAWWMLPNQQMMRHRAVLWLPSIGKRAKAESLAIFAWTLSMVSRAGIAPRTAWVLASQAMPNLLMAARMRQVGDAMQDGSRLSEAMQHTGLLPTDFGAIVSNGELVGDVPSALLTVSAASRDEYERQSGMSKMRIGCWGGLVVAFVLLISGIAIAHYYTNLIQVVPGD